MSDPVYLGGVSYDPQISSSMDNVAASNEQVFEAGLSSGQAQMSGYAKGEIAALEAGGTPLTADQANAKYGVQGLSPELSLSWKPGDTVDEGVAQVASQAMKDKNLNDYLLGHRNQTWGGFGAAAGGEILGSLADPVNLAGMLLPTGALTEGAALGSGLLGLTRVAEASRALAAGMDATAVGRMGGAALNNAATVALTEPLIMAGAHQEHQDISFTQAAQDVLFGGIIGGGLHGVGEAMGATWRSMTRAGANGLETGDRSGDMASDIFKADPIQVKNDLREQLGRDPTDPEINQEVQTRQSEFQQKRASGVYDATVPEHDEPTDSYAVPDNVLEMHRNGDYEGASKALEQHVNSLEQDPQFKPSEEMKDEVSEPVQNHEQAKKLIDDFNACVQAEAA